MDYPSRKSIQAETLHAAHTPSHLHHFSARFTALRRLSRARTRAGSDRQSVAMLAAQRTRPGTGAAPTDWSARNAALRHLLLQLRQARYTSVHDARARRWVHAQARGMQAVYARDVAQQAVLASTLVTFEGRRLNAATRPRVRTPLLGTVRPGMLLTVMCARAALPALLGPLSHLHRGIPGPSAWSFASVRFVHRPRVPVQRAARAPRRLANSRAHGG